MSKSLWALCLPFIALSSLSFNAMGADQSIMQAQKLMQTLSATKQLYVDEVDESKLVDDAITGMLEKLDPHSVYIPAKDVEKANEVLTGGFDGIGVQFQMLKDTLFVVQAIPGGPSEKVGIVAGDRIISANDTSIVKMKSIDIQKRLRGKKGTRVKVEVVRRGQKNPIVFNITRDKIPIYSVDAAFMAAPKVGYIRVSSFSANMVEQFGDSLRVLINRGAENLILDLQGNGGGYLVAAFQLANHFLPNKDMMIVYTEGAHAQREEMKSNGMGWFQKGKLVVLVDESSASASEILSGAIQDWDRGVIVGRRTFGKGLVQRPLTLNDGSQIRLTTGRYYTPSSRCIQRPYDSGADNYRHDLIDRYNRGEMTDADKIHFPDSLKCYTLVNKRTVYGGGGIMPDVFVPVDTTRYSDFHRDLLAKGTINKFVTNYVDKNRKDLTKTYNLKQKGAFEKFKEKFSLEESDLKILLAEAEKDSVKFNQEQYDKSKDLIKFQLKALIARNLWSTNEYFQIWCLRDPSFLKALDILGDEKMYENCLKGGK